MSLESDSNMGVTYCDNHRIEYRRMFSTGGYNYSYETDLGNAYVNISYLNDDNFTITIKKELNEGENVSDEVLNLLVKHFLQQAIKQDREFFIVKDNIIKIYK